MPRREPTPIVIQPTELDWARLAAYIDGEGCILLGSGRQKISNDHLRIIVANTDPRLMIWIRERFGGKILRTYKRKDKPLWRHGMKWYISCQQAYAILKGCYPYLICKVEQADIAFAFQETISRPGVKGHKPEVYERRRELRAQLSQVRWRQYSEEEIHDIADWGNRVQ